MLTTASSSPLAKYLLPVHTLCCACLESLISKAGTFPLGDTIMIPLKCKLRPPSGHFGLRMPVNQQAKKGVTVLTGLIDPESKGELDFYSIMEVRKNVSRAQAIPQGVSWYYQALQLRSIEKYSTMQARLLKTQTLQP